MTTLTEASIDRFLARLETSGSDGAARRRAGRNIGRIVGSRDRVAMTKLQRKLASLSGTDAEANGYFTALRDVTGAALRELDRDSEIDSLVAQANEPRRGWRTVLEALVDGPSTPGEISARAAKNQSRVSTTLKALRQERLVEDYGPEPGQDGRRRPYRLTLAGRELSERLGFTESLPEALVAGLDTAISFFEQLLVMTRVLTSRFEREMPATINPRQRGAITRHLIQACQERGLILAEEGVALRLDDELSTDGSGNSAVPRSGNSAVPRKKERR